METRDIILTYVMFIVIMAVGIGVPYTTYRVGRRLERKELTGALIKTLEDTYYEGIADGLRRCGQ